MNHIQQFLVIGGLVLISFLALNFYRASDIQYGMKYENEAIITATGIAQSIFEDMNTKAFDEKTISTKIDTLAYLTTLVKLGKDSGEVAKASFDDVDDYNGYSMTDSSMGLGNFNVSVLVRYVLSSDLNTLATSQTFSKKATIFLSNSYLKKQLQLNYTFSY